jgi:N utilization substance protein A
MIIDKLIALGIISVPDLEDVGTEPLVKELNIEATLAEQLVSSAAEHAKQLAAESRQNKAENLLKQQEEPAENEK